MVKITPDILRPALRQYDYNTWRKNGFDYDETIEIVNTLLALIGEQSLHLANMTKDSRARQEEMQKLMAWLCRHEGHLPITDHNDRTWCELCGTEIFKLGD